jgi:ABC-type multidrug transport system fused ATPase/permease subunit
MQFRLDLMGSILLLSVSLLAVASSEMGLDVNPSQLGLLMTHALNVPSLFQWAIMLSTEVEANFNCVARVRHYSIESDHESWSAKDDKATASIQNGWPSAGKVEFRNLTLRYRKDLPIVLNKVNVTFPAGSRVGIVGRTGSGKSTMLISLFRMVEASEGSIFIDGIVYIYNK